MENYIIGLVEDILAVADQAHIPATFSSECEIPDIENNTLCNFEQTLGISYIQFPPSDRLNDKQMLTVIDALDHTLQTFDFTIEVPERVPLALKYELYRDLFLEEHFVMPGFTCHYDFCSGYCPGCKVADFCDARFEVWGDTNELSNVS